MSSEDDIPDRIFWHLGDKDEFLQFNGSELTIQCKPEEFLSKEEMTIT